VLSTCWPFDAVTSGPARYVLHATMIGPSGATVEHRPSGAIPDTRPNWIRRGPDRPSRRGPDRL